MPQSCYISACDSISIAACFCCNQYLCCDHLIEHDYLLRLKLNHLNEQMNELNCQVEAFDIKKISKEFFLKLNQWRFDSHQIIDQFYEKKCQELNQYLNEILHKHQEEILDLNLKIAKMFNIQQTTNNSLEELTSNIQNLKQQINQIENLSIQLDIGSLIINDHLININILNPYQSDFSRLSSPDQIIDRAPLTSDAIASNQQYLLMHQNSNLYLIDQNLIVIHETKWPNNWIRDMCWSQILNSFFLITSDNIYLVEQNTLSIKHIKTIEGRFWQSCTCSNTSLYLSKDLWNSSIEEFCLKPSIEFVKHCERIEVKDQKQRIDHIECNNQTIALVINDQTKQEIFIELRSIKNFYRLWFCRIFIDYSERKIQCCLFNYNTWIVADWGTSSLFHITENGNIKEIIKYKYQIRDIHLFGRNKLVISTDDSIHFHKL